LKENESLLREGFSVWRKTSILIISIMLIGSLTGIASAAVYSVAANNYDNGTYSAHGTYGYNYVMDSPAVTSLHVSSIYVKSSNTNNMAEAGWVIAPNRNIDTTHFFSAWVDNGAYNDIIWEEAPSGTNHNYKVQNLIGTNKWRFYVDGTQKLERTYSSGFQYGASICSSERNESSDTNYSHFWSLRYKNSSDTWSNWYDLRELLDNDQDYRLVINSDTSCYMQL